MASPAIFKSISVTEHLATAFQQREPGQKTVKRPVQRPRRSAVDEGPTETASDAVVASRLLHMVA